MSEVRTELENGLREARDNLRELLASARKARAVRLVGTLVGMAIAIIYAFAFVNLITAGFNPQKLTSALQREIQAPAMRNTLNLALKDVVNEVWPVFWDEATEAGLEADLRRELQELLKEIGPAYRQQIDRVAPEIFAALKEELPAMIREISDGLQTRIEAELRSSLERNEEYIRQQVNLSPEEVEKKLADIVIAALVALEDVVTTRTDRYLADLAEIEGMLDQIPPAKETNPQALLDEIGDVSIHLLKLSLPESGAQLEW